MAYEQRRLVNNLSGTLAARASATDSQITCQGSVPGITNVFAALPTDLSQTLYMPLVLANDATGKFEVVWATGHASASPTLTVVRNREGTDAQTFEVGDTVRCAATSRDLGGLTVATRSALPSDPHLGLRVGILDENVVVERSPLGWIDAAPIGPDAKRKHRWTQSGASLSAGTAATLTGLTGSQNGTTGNIGSMANGVFKANKAGVWNFAFALYIGNLGVRNQGLEMNWPGTALFVTGDNLYDYRGVNSGSNGLSLITSGPIYVPSSAKDIGMTLRAFSSIAATNCQFDFFAEYLGA